MWVCLCIQKDIWLLFFWISYLEIFSSWLGYSAWEFDWCWERYWTKDIWTIERVPTACRGWQGEIERIHPPLISS